MGANIAELQAMLAKKDAKIRELEVSYKNFISWSLIKKTSTKVVDKNVSQCSKCYHFKKVLIKSYFMQKIYPRKVYVKT